MTRRWQHEPLNKRRNGRHAPFLYGTANGNPRQAARLYQERFPNRYIPSHRMFSNLHQRIRDNGSFEMVRRDAGRQRRVNVEAVVDT